MKRSTGFTLIEMLVVFSVIGILISFLFVALQGTRKSGRDAKRKTDLEQIRSALEMYRSDCSQYPASLTWGGTLTGSCPTSQTYMSLIPRDPLSTNYYRYQPVVSGSVNVGYLLCAYLETGSVTTGCTACTGNCSVGVNCNYATCNP